MKGIGTGKTFLVTCFAGEVGIPAVSLKNFRSMWQGVTEGNLERALNLLRAMSPIAVSKVIWFLLTCGSDLLPVDLKRQGRAEEHIALFYPDTDEERLALLRAMQKKTGTQVASPDAEKFFLERAAGLSGADIEAVLIRARLKSVLENEAAVDVDDLKAALEDFISPSYPTEIELQNLAAVRECTSRSLLPERYRNLDRAELIRRANELAALAGE